MFEGPEKNWGSSTYHQDLWVWTFGLDPPPDSFRSDSPARSRSQGTLPRGLPPRTYTIKTDNLKLTEKQNWETVIHNLRKPVSVFTLICWLYKKIRTKPQWAIIQESRSYILPPIAIFFFIILIEFGFKTLYRHRFTFIVTPDTTINLKIQNKNAFFFLVHVDNEFLIYHKFLVHWLI